MHSYYIGDDWHAHFNGDFSGDVIFEKKGETGPIKLPFVIVKALVAEYVRREKIARIEDQSPDETFFSQM